jgi:hypothetical protein
MKNSLVTKVQGKNAWENSEICGDDLSFETVHWDIFIKNHESNDCFGTVFEIIKKDSK